MIDYLFGTVSAIHTEYLSIRTPSGVGYRAYAPASYLNAITVGEEQEVYTSVVIREQSHTMYAFPNGEDRDFFDALCKIRGVGPGIAVRMLSLGKDAIDTMIQAGDVRGLTRIPKLGPKLAQGIIQERHNLPLSTTVPTARIHQPIPPAVPPAHEAITRFLVGMGTREHLAKEAADHVHMMEEQARIPEALKYIADRHRTGA